MIRGRRSERGAIAVIFAICTVMFFALAALGVDLGNAMNRKKELQTNADLAALAGGGHLPADSLTPTSSDDIVLEVAKYLIKNKVYDDLSGMSVPTQDVLAEKLVSGLPSDIQTYGRVQYGHYVAGGTFVPSKNYVTVTAPETRVRFGIATAVGFGGVNVASRAAAALMSKSSGAATLPFYAYNGCDWGTQIISHSTVNAAPPNLKFAAEDNDSDFTQPSVLVGNPTPHQVSVGDTTSVLNVTGTNLTISANINTHPGANEKGVTALGLFLPDGSDPVIVPAIANTKFLSGSSATNIRFQLPSTVANNDGAVYYLRVQAWFKKNGNWVKQWSQVTTNMPYVEIGSATLFCNDDKSAGNFGSLSVFRADTNSTNESSGWLPLNIAVGLDEPEVRLNPYVPSPPGPNACDNGDSAAYHSDEPASGVLVNCVVTNVGFPQNSATNGFLTGVDGDVDADGRLTSDSATTAGCGGVNGAPPLRHFPHSGDPAINNEHLTCFFADDAPTGLKVSDISSEGYAGGVVLNASIWGSPRFFQVPVINVQPANGKKSFPIVAFRYAFLTGENAASTKAAPSYWDDAETNGLALTGNNWNSVKVESFRVVFIHPAAVPPKPGGGTPIEFDGKDGSLYLVD